QHHLFVAHPYKVKLFLNSGRVLTYTSAVMGVKHAEEINLLVSADQLCGDLIGERPTIGIACNPVRPFGLNRANHLRHSHRNSFDGAERRFTRWSRRQAIYRDAGIKVRSEKATKVIIDRWMHQEKRRLRGAFSQADGRVGRGRFAYQLDFPGKRFNRRVSEK